MMMCIMLLVSGSLMGSAAPGANNHARSKSAPVATVITVKPAPAHKKVAMYAVYHEDDAEKKLNELAVQLVRENGPSEAASMLKQKLKRFPRRMSSNEPGRLVEAGMNEFEAAKKVHDIVARAVIIVEEENKRAKSSCWSCKACS